VVNFCLQIAPFLVFGVVVGGYAVEFEQESNEASEPQGGAVMAIVEMWTFSVETTPNIDLTGFKVEATDGEIGKVDDATNEVGGSFIIVDTGPWIFGRKVLIPAGLVQDIDPDSQTIFVNRTKDEIKNAPEFDEQLYRDQKYRDELGSYYTRGAMPRDTGR
jgi:hypothetical protein